MKIYLPIVGLFLLLSTLGWIVWNLNNKSQAPEESEASSLVSDGICPTSSINFSDVDCVNGVHSPIMIEPNVEILNSDYVSQLYNIFYDREYDKGGYIANLRHANDREGLFNIFLNSNEYTSNPNLANRRNYIYRLYKYLLKRIPSESEIDHWANSAQNMFQMYNSFTSSQEFEDVNCHGSYYLYGQKLKDDALVLQNLFDGSARFQTIEEGQRVNLQFDTISSENVWDQKLPIIFDEKSGKYYGFTRGYLVSNSSFNIFMMESLDGINFHEVGPVFEKNDSSTFYDPHIAVDYSVCPAQYIMTFECENASLCVSKTTTPFKTESWSTPQIIVSSGEVSGRYHSASTGVSLIVNSQRYISWTEIDDGKVWFESVDHVLFQDEGNESTSSQAVAINSFDNTLGSVADFSSYILRSEANVNCNSGWDCNNKDVQDWKFESDYYYLVYNGANYYRCIRPSGSDKTSSWALSIARSKEPLSNYNEQLSDQLRIIAEKKDTCGISYPTINQIDGELYLYYAYYPMDVSDGTNLTWRSKIVPNCIAGDGKCPHGCSLSNDADCTVTCVPACSAKVCGSDGCGGSCGSCSNGQTCNENGQCVSTCTADCSDKTCGTNGCGGSCGSCSGNTVCNTSGQCVSTETSIVIQITIDLQVKTNESNDEVWVKIKNNAGSIVYDGKVKSNEAGKLTDIVLSNIDAGEYTIWIKPKIYLSRKVQKSLVLGQNVVKIAEPFLVGDLDDSLTPNIIKTADYSMLVGAYFKEDCGYRNFDGICTVNLKDVSLMYGNWFKTGDPFD